MSDKTDYLNKGNNMKRLVLFSVVVVALVGCSADKDGRELNDDLATATDDFIVYTDEKPRDVDSKKFDSVYAKAMQGDYQAQRNLAFGYSSMPYSGQEVNKISACAWRIVIIESASDRVDSTDVSNYEIDCTLDDASKSAAESQAKEIMSQL